MSSRAILTISAPNSGPNPGWKIPVWDLNIRVDTNIESTTQTLPLKIRNRNLASEKIREDIRWLMEDHATKDPFDISRANSTRTVLKQISLDLAEDIAQSVAVQLPKRGSKLCIRIRQTDREHLMYCIPWELLFDRMPWAFSGILYEAVCVERVAGCQPIPRPPQQRPHSLLGDDGRLHMLLLCSRPEKSNETIADLISEPIARLISSYPGLRHSVKLHMVRPGTWSAVVEALHAKPKGFYKLVHIDMHGQVEGTTYSLNFLRSSSRGKIRRQKVSARQISEQLAEHGVEVVTMNACESAYITSIGEISANFAQMLLERGIKAVSASSFKAMDSTMEIFYSTMFLHFLTGDDLQTAVMAGRKRLYDYYDNKDLERKAVLGRKVITHDFCAPIFYSRGDVQMDSLYTIYRKDIEFMQLERLMYREFGISDEDIPREIFGRVSDTLKVETLLGTCPIVLIHGYGGVGKTAFVRRLGWWWSITGLIQEIVYLDLETVPQTSDASQIVNYICERLGSATSSVIESKLIVLDNLEVLGKRFCTLDPDRLEQKRLRGHLEAIVGANEDAYSEGNTYIILVSREANALSWDLSLEIASYRLTGLPIYHGLELGFHEVRKGSKVPGLAVPINSEEKDNLEKVIQILDGNPLAIKIVFRDFGRSRLTIGELLEKTLAGGIKMDRDYILADSAGSRFLFDCAESIHRWREELPKGSPFIAPPHSIFGLFNLVVPADMVTFVYTFARSIMDEQRRRLFLDLDGLINNPSHIPSMKAAFRENGCGEELRMFYSKAQEVGAFIQLKTDKIMDDPPEFYYIHPVLTLILRDMLFQTKKQLVTESKAAFVHHRIFWDATCAIYSQKNVPRYLLSDFIKRAFITAGKWSTVAAVIHAQKLAERTPPDPVFVPWSVRLLIPIAPNMHEHTELVALLRPYLLKELQRHISAPQVLHEHPCALYSALKLAYCLRYSSRADIWEKIYRVIAIAERVMESGKALFPESQLSLVEIRSVDVARYMHSHERIALDILERNLKFQPNVAPTYPDLPAIRRDYSQNLIRWALLSHKLSTDKLRSGKEVDDKKLKAVEPETVPREDFASIMTTMLRETVEPAGLDSYGKSFDRTMKEHMQLLGADISKLSTFSPFAQSIANMTIYEISPDLIPDGEAAKESFAKNARKMLASQNFNIELAGVEASSGDSSKAKERLFAVLKRQLQESNDAPTNYYIHSTLAKIAVQEEKWDSAVEHYHAMINLGTEGVYCYTWLEICKCHDKQGDIERLRAAALKAISEAIEHMHRSESRKFAMLQDTFFGLFQLKHIRDYSCVFPKRKHRAEDVFPEFEDDLLNEALLFQRFIIIENQKPDYYEAVSVDSGVLFRTIWETTREYWSLYLEDENATSFTLPGNLTQDLKLLVCDMNLLESELVGLGVNISDEEIRVEVSKEAETFIFRPENAKLRFLKGTRWVKESAGNFLRPPAWLLPALAPTL